MKQEQWEAQGEEQQPVQCTQIKMEEMQ